MIALSDVEEVLHQAVVAVEDFVSCPELRIAFETRTTPPTRLVIFGRRGVGKSSLVQALTGVEVPTGLGGVTREPMTVEGGGLVAIDLPGLEDDQRATAELRAAVATVDAAVWVIDGLSPITQLERSVVQRAVPAWMGLHAIIARSDLLDAPDRDAVIERVVALTRSYALLSIHAVDARAPGASVHDALKTIAWARSPVRCVALFAGLRAAQQALDHLPEPQAAADVADHAAMVWRDAVRTAHAIVEREVLVGHHLAPGGAIRALHRALDDAVASLHAELLAVDALSLPWRPATPQESGFDLHRLLSGVARVQRELRAYAAQQATEGEIACLDLVDSPGGRALEERRRAYRRAWRLVDQGRRGLTGLGLPHAIERSLFHPESPC